MIEKGIDNDKITNKILSLTEITDIAENTIEQNHYRLEVFWLNYFNELKNHDIICTTILPSFTFFKKYFCKFEKNFTDNNFLMSILCSEQLPSYTVSQLNQFFVENPKSKYHFSIGTILYYSEDDILIYQDIPWNMKIHSRHLPMKTILKSLRELNWDWYSVLQRLDSSSTYYFFIKVLEPFENEVFQKYNNVIKQQKTKNGRFLKYDSGKLEMFSTSDLRKIPLDYFSENMPYELLMNDDIVCYFPFDENKIFKNRNITMKVLKQHKQKFELYLAYYNDTSVEKFLTRSRHISLPMLDFVNEFYPYQLSYNKFITEGILEVYKDSFTHYNIANITRQKGLSLDIYSLWKDRFDIALSSKMTSTLRELVLLKEYFFANVIQDLMKYLYHPKRFFQLKKKLMLSGYDLQEEEEEEEEEEEDENKSK